ncbi:hypothetical protein EAI_06196 [Harpegnathos saltator]|uniref:Uncharacterized protein n=1 Tax=Harpegnathos saltator TaxID=610380 RepID=E2B4S6_HARSA|nr:hypothetical protein EAI_06196 [Harpegnathos saltator]
MNKKENPNRSTLTSTSESHVNRIQCVTTDNEALMLFNECLWRMRKIVISTLASFSKSDLHQMTKEPREARRRVAVYRLRLYEAQQARLEVRGERKKSQCNQHRRRRNEVLTLKGETEPRGVDCLGDPTIASVFDRAFRIVWRRR